MVNSPPFDGGETEAQSGAVPALSPIAGQQYSEGVGQDPGFLFCFRVLSCHPVGQAHSPVSRGVSLGPLPLACRYLSHTELAPLRAPLIPMEHCTTRFFETCDLDHDKYIALDEWAGCFGIKESECLSKGATFLSPPPLYSLSSVSPSSWPSSVLCA